MTQALGASSSTSRQISIIGGISLALYATIVADARARAMVRERRVALIVAQSQLDRAASGDRTESGRYGALSWQLQREPYDEDAAFAQHRLEQLTISVTDANNAPLLRLTTVRALP